MLYNIKCFSRTGELNFEGVFDNLKLIDVKTDRQEYAKMFEELASRGAVSVFEDNEDIQIESIWFESIEDIVKYLVDVGFNVKLERLEHELGNTAIS